jgi:hypothetical protein
MTQINHRALRNNLRAHDGYRALSDAIRAQIDEVASKSLDTEAAWVAMLGLPLDGAYLSWLRAKREAVRTALWTEAARVLTGNPTSLRYIGSTAYGAALALSENPAAVGYAKSALGDYGYSDEDEDEADADADADADAEEIDA